jgi:hypothetical protein
MLAVDELGELFLGDGLRRASLDGEGPQQVALDTGELRIG